MNHAIKMIMAQGMSKCPKCSQTLEPEVMDTGKCGKCGHEFWGD